MGRRFESGHRLQRKDQRLRSGSLFLLKDLFQGECYLAFGGGANMKSINKKWLAVITAILAACATGILSITVLHVPALFAILIILVEAAMAFFMHKAPLYLHVGVVAAEVILGVATKNVVFLILGSVVYFCFVLAFHYLLRREERSRKKQTE